MQLKEAFEAVTENIDVRPGFVGDVMTGARRRRTRKLLIITAVVALLAGGIAGRLLTRPDPELTAADHRFSEPTHGDLANTKNFIDLVQKLVLKTPSGRTHIYWAGNTPEGPAAIVLREVKVDHVQGWATAIMLITTNEGGPKVALEEVPVVSEQGLFRFGPAKESTYLVLARPVPVQYSMRAVRDANGKVSREWRELPIDDGVAVVKAGADDKPVFLPGSFQPDLAPLEARWSGQGTAAFQPHAGTGWDGRTYIGSPGYDPPQRDPEPVWTMLRKNGFIDFPADPISLNSRWDVVAALPDSRTALVVEFDAQLFAVLYRGGGEVDRIVVGPEVAKDSPLPVRVALPDGQGIVVAAYGSLLGPEERVDAWLAPAGTTEIAVKRGDQVQVVPL